MFKDYYEARDWLEEFIPYTYSKKNLGLERITYLLKLLGNPQNKFKSIHVAGTSGKGSTAFYIAKLLEFAGPAARFPRPTSLLRTKLDTEFKMSSDAAGARRGSPGTRVTRNADLSLKVGLHLSPHLVYIGERIQIDGVPISPMRLIRLIGRIRPIVEKIKKTRPDFVPSYFEILVAASFLYFAEEKVDWAVVEVGLGGRLDATNVLQSELSVITNVGLDHTEILGETIEKIAFEKAGIIKKSKVKSQKSKVAWPWTGVPVVTGALPSSGSSTGGKALKVIEKVAREKNALLINLNTLSFENLPKTDLERYITKRYYTFKDIHDNFASSNRFPRPFGRGSLFLAQDLPRLRNVSRSFFAQNKNLALLAFLTLMSLRDHEVAKQSFLKDRRASLAMTVDNGVLTKAFSEPLAGRFEEIDDNVILDCAHNTDKVKFLIRAIKSYTNYSNNQSEVVLVVAFKKGKSWKKMIDLLVKSLPVKKIIATKFYAVTDTGPFAAVEPSEIAKYAMSIVNSQSTIVKIVENSQEALFEAINNSVIASGTKQSKKKIATPLHSLGARNDRCLVLVTGSLYLVGEVRTMWKLPEF